MTYSTYKTYNGIKSATCDDGPESAIQNAAHYVAYLYHRGIIETHHYNVFIDRSSRLSQQIKMSQPHFEDDLRKQYLAAYYAIDDHLIAKKQFNYAKILAFIVLSAVTALLLPVGVYLFSKNPSRFFFKSFQRERDELKNKHTQLMNLFPKNIVIKEPAQGQYVGIKTTNDQLLFFPHVDSCLAIIIKLKNGTVIGGHVPQIWDAQQNLSDKNLEVNLRRVEAKMHELLSYEPHQVAKIALIGDESWLFVQEEYQSIYHPAEVSFKPTSSKGMDISVSNTKISMVTSSRERDIIRELPTQPHGPR